MSKFVRQAFPELADKRLSELSPAQRDDAHEDWIRANWAFARDIKTIEFLLLRIDALRTSHNELLKFVVDSAAFHDKLASNVLDRCCDAIADYSWFDNPETVKEARELLKRLDLLPPRS